MEPEESEKYAVDTQVSFGGFDRHVKAAELVKYLEAKIGAMWRCRLKASSTPQESYPDFSITNTAEIKRRDDYDKVEPHAFVHLATQSSVACAVDAAGHTELFLNNQALKVSLGPENAFRLNHGERTSTPFKILDVRVEIGSLVTQDEFSVAWRGPASGADFLVDPFDGTCKICFVRDTAFSIKGYIEHAVIKCQFKVEFLVREINIFKQYSEWAHVVTLLRLASSPRVWYRTADDDIEVLVPFDLLDDDDPWI